MPDNHSTSLYLVHMKSQTEIQQLNVLEKTLQIPASESWILIDDSNNDMEQTIVLME